jgi:DNA polymerase I
LSTLRLGVPVTKTTGDTYTELSVDGETITESTKDILTAVQAAVDERNPDILVCSTCHIIPTLHEMATHAGVDGFSLSRWPDVDYQQLASQSKYSSYGRVGHSPARYNVPGRAIIDESNTFFYGETNLDGVLDLVSRSKKPIQELAWASIGNVLTAIQICEAHDRDVLVPWNSWRHEFYKPMGTLHDADRGGFIFAPEVGLHEDVHEFDFSSLYPNIICTHNVSPDVIRCECHRDRDDVPGLDYSICDDHGYLVDVLQPIIDARGWRVIHGIVDSIWVTPDPDVEDSQRVDLDVLAR